MTLYIATNEWLLYEYLNIRDEIQDDTIYVTIEKSYNKYKSNYKRMLGTINRGIEQKLFNGYIEFEHIDDFEYDTIIAPACPYDEMMEKLSTVTTNNYILIEEGSYDYSENVKVPDIWKSSVKYLSFPEKAKNKENPLKKIEYKQELFDFMLNNIIEHRVKKLPSNIDVLVFTSPTNEGLKKHEVLEYVDGKYSDKNVLLCKHPRDNSDYKGYDYISGVPGQFINVIYPDAKQDYLHESTVKLYVKQNIGEV